MLRSKGTARAVALRELVNRFAAFTTKTKDDLDRLARDIVTAQHTGDTGDTTVKALYKRFRDLQTITSEHAQLLSTSLDDTDTALQLVNMQLSSLFAHADTGDE